MARAHFAAEVCGYRVGVRAPLPSYSRGVRQRPLLVLLVSRLNRASILGTPPTHANNERTKHATGAIAPAPSRATVPGRAAHLPRIPHRPVGKVDRAVAAVPLANVLVAVIPFTEHFAPLYLLPPTVVTPLASVTSLFVPLATYARRGAVAAAHGRDRARRSATVCFTTGLAALAVYLRGPYCSGRTCPATPGTPRSGGDSKLVAGDLTFVCLYRWFLALLTRAFLLLAMLNTFNSPTEDHPKQGRTELPDRAEIPDLLQYWPLNAVMQYPTRTAVSVKP